MDISFGDPPVNPFKFHGRSVLIASSVWTPSAVLY